MEREASTKTGIMKDHFFPHFPLVVRGPLRFFLYPLPFFSLLPTW